MRFGHGSQSLCSIWATSFLLIGTAVNLPGTAPLFAQDNSGQVDSIAEVISAGSALAKIEADGHSPSEARQLLQGRLPTEQHGSNPTSSAGAVSSAQLLDDQLYVQGSREYISLVKQQLKTIQEFGLTQLSYTMFVVEVPTEAAMGIVEEWQLAGRSMSIEHELDSGSASKHAVVPASFAASTTEFEFRLSGALSDQQINELVVLGKIVASPEIVGQNGAEVNVQTGREVQFVATYEPVNVKDEDGNDSLIMQPKVSNLLDGIKLDLTGVLDDKKANVQLALRISHSQVGEIEPFTIESKQGPLTVQQPDFRCSSIQTTCHVPINTTMATCSGPIIRETVVQQRVPLIGRVPYLGKLFTNTAKATESISTIVLIRCQEHKPASL